MIVLQLIQQLLLEHYLRNIYQKKKKYLPEFIYKKNVKTQHIMGGGGG